MKEKKEIKMAARFPGECALCEGSIQAGDQIIFIPGDGAYHVDCWENYSRPVSAGISPAELEERLHSFSSLPPEESIQRKRELAAELRAAGFDPATIQDEWLRAKITRLMGKNNGGK